MRISANGIGMEAGSDPSITRFLFRKTLLGEDGIRKTRKSKKNIRATPLVPSRQYIPGITYFFGKKKWRKFYGWWWFFSEHNIHSSQSTALTPAASST